MNTDYAYLEIVMGVGGLFLALKSNGFSTAGSTSGACLETKVEEKWGKNIIKVGKSVPSVIDGLLHKCFVSFCFAYGVFVVIF